MFGFFSSVDKRIRDNARHWVELGDKVHDYRRDVLSTSDRTELTQAVETVRGLLKEKAESGKLKLATERLEEVLRRHGGKFYPRSTVQEYVEFFVVGAIVILGIRAYYVQPFKIPTNSMWPTYYGMTPEVYSDDRPEPTAVEKVFRLATLGASHINVVAPKSGKIFLPVQLGSSAAYPWRRAKPARKWGVIPTTNQEYGFMIDLETWVRFEVPEDFDAWPAIREAFGLSDSKLLEMARNARVRDGNIVLVELPRLADAGKPILRFDILTGDQLFVDRFSYHFIKPKVGDGFVFRTGNIPDLAAEKGDQYYIKRLAGVPGDKLEIREPALYRNGVVASGTAGFDGNSKRTPPYTGYVNPWRAPFLARGDQIEVPEHRYFALGDNSSNSLDSRFWGYVPYKDVVGRPLFVFYPFTKRVGPAR